MEDCPLCDLTIFRFPEVTTTIVANIALLLVLLAMAVFLTVAVQRWLHERHAVREHREKFEHAAHETRLPNFARQTLNKLIKLSPYKKEFDLVRDAEAFERAVEALYATGEEDAAEGVARLRRSFHLNVMNPNLELVSTRQLLADLPVRLIAHVSGQTLDIYCTLMDVSEEGLLIDVPRDEEILEFLRRSTGTLLIFWREPGGETVFPVRLEFVPSEELTLVRAGHAMRSEAASQRADFRLTVDFPLTYLFITREKVGKLRAAADQKLDMIRGEGRLLDLSYGGGAFVAEQPLETGGLAQLQFKIHDRGVHVMLEVLDRGGAEGGRYLHRGRFRGMSNEVRQVLNRYLSREQMARLREKDVFHKKPAG